MPTEVIEIKADSINAEADEIIRFLNGSSNWDVAYFDGWDGLGASAVLKEVVKRLRSSFSGAATGTVTGLDKVIHIDCSLWQNKRAVQKQIAEELDLPQHVLAVFDQHDEEDDFNGVEQGARGVIQHVKEAILDDLLNRRFLVVFHNGSGSYIDLWECGVPVIGYRGRRVLWTSRGRFRLHGIQEEDVKKLAGLSSLAICAALSSDLEVNRFKSLLHAEAAEVAKYTGVPWPDLCPKIVIKCIFYKALIDDDNNGIDWGTHAPNYWVCNGIIQNSLNGDKSAWEIADVLHRNLHMDWHQFWVVNIRRYIQQQQQQQDDNNNEEIATSFFRTAPEPSSINNKNATTTTILKGGDFGHYSDRNKLRVIHLSHCIFSFANPPFLGCSNLRFLLLDYCEDEDTTAEEDSRSQSGLGDGASCFRNLWVLDMSYTDWYFLLSKKMLDSMAELRELNVKGVKNWSISHLCPDSGVGNRLVKLRVTGEPTYIDGSDKNPVSPAIAFPNLSSWWILRTIVLDGCVELDEIDTNALPPLLESFSFLCSVNANIKSISFRGRTRLKNLLLRGLFGRLLDLDLSGTALETLDLSAMQAPCLEKFFLLGCEKLRAIIWPKEGKPEFVRLHIHTTLAASAWEDDIIATDIQAVSLTALAWEDDIIATDIQAVSLTQQLSQDLDYFDLYISLRDTKLLRSLLHVRHVKYASHVEISSAASSSVSPSGAHKGAATNQGFKSDVGYGRQRAVRSLESDNLGVDNIADTYKDNLAAVSAEKGKLLAASALYEAPEIGVMWPSGPGLLAASALYEAPEIGVMWPSGPGWLNCYISIQEEVQQSTLPQGTTLPEFVHDAWSLDLHDSLSITCIPGPAPSSEDLRWNNLLWCRLQRCPNLNDAVFTAPIPSDGERKNTMFWNLRTLWAFELLYARYIWDWSTSLFRPGPYSFMDLRFLHLDRCPRLIHVLPLCTSNLHGCSRLESLEIEWCSGDLKEVFPLESEHQEPREFPSLKRIHLRELPSLHAICGRRMLAPKLMTVVISGCWSLRRLPVVHGSGSTSRTTLLPEVNCEKEWWDCLEWDGMEVGHHPSLYKTIHSKYYKKTLLRGSVLR